MRSRVWLAAAVVLAGLAGQGNAQERRPIDAFCNSGPVMSPLTRLSVGIAMRKDFREFSDKIPTLSPSEDAWLKKEYDDQIASAGSFNSRAIAASKSVEFKKKYVTNTIKRILVQLYNLDQVISAKDRKKEIEIWSLVTARLIDQTYAEAVVDLSNKGVIKQTDVPFVVGHASAGMIQNLLAQCILDNVIPNILDK